MNKKALYTIPGDSTVLYTPVSYYRSCILYDYDKEDGTVARSGISFFCPLAMRERSERCSKIWHSHDCFYRLVEVEDSDWLKEILDDVPDRYKLPQDKYNATNSKHYMIYLDGICYEVIAQAWDILPEQEGTWEEVFPDDKQFFVRSAF